MSLVRCYPNLVEASAACGGEILRHLDAAIAARGRALLAVSGGATPRFLFRYFAQARQDWSRVHVYWTDERCVPAGDARSNYRLARETWLDVVKFPAENVHRVHTELGLKAAAGRYDEELRAAGPFDVIHRGMGTDGHTASLFPGDPLIRDRERFAAAVDGDPPRITMLPAVLEAARHTVVLVTGADKAGMLERVLRSPYDPVKYPVQIAALDENTARWYVDRDACPGGEPC